MNPTNIGAESIVLGCTEIPLIIKQQDTELPLFNALTIRSLAAPLVLLWRSIRTTLKRALKKY